MIVYQLHAEKSPLIRDNFTEGQVHLIASRSCVLPQDRLEGPESGIDYRGACSRTCAMRYRARVCESRVADRREIVVHGLWKKFETKVPTC